VLLVSTGSDIVKKGTNDEKLERLNTNTIKARRSMPDEEQSK
jgi:hypothetical protein